MTEHTSGLPRPAQAYTELTRALGGAFNREPIDSTLDWIKRTLHAHEEDGDADIDVRLALAIQSAPRHCCETAPMSDRIRRLIALLEWPLSHPNQTMSQEDMDWMRIVLEDLDRRFRGLFAA